jgi:hypothetical protein
MYKEYLEQMWKKKKRTAKINYTLFLLSSPEKARKHS